MPKPPSAAGKAKAVAKRVSQAVKKAQEEFRAALEKGKVTFADVKNAAKKKLSESAAAAVAAGRAAFQWVIKAAIANPIFGPFQEGWWRDGSLTETVGADKPGTEIIYVNGIQTSPDEHEKNKEFISTAFNRPVRGIYNATNGWIGDFVQVGLDKARVLSPNPATLTLSTEILKELSAGKDVELVLHSQGAIIGSNALSLVKYMLMAQNREAELKKITVTTLGGAAMFYPDGPKYHHWAFNNDPVPVLVGTGWLSSTIKIPGPLNPVTAHKLETYMKNKERFEAEEKRRREETNSGTR